MAYPTKQVHRWSKLGSPGATSFLALSTGAWGATGVHLISSTIPTCHGPSVATATVSLYGYFSQQHVRWRLSTRGDIRTLASTSSTLEAQISTVKKLTEDNFLKLISSMCEVVAFKRASNRTFEERIEAGECSFPVGGKATCLGYQWKDGSAENWRRDTRPTSPQQY